VAEACFNCVGRTPHETETDQREDAFQRRAIQPLSHGRRRSNTSRSGSRHSVAFTAQAQNTLLLEGRLQSRRPASWPPGNARACVICGRLRHTWRNAHAVVWMDARLGSTTRPSSGRTAGRRRAYSHEAALIPEPLPTDVPKRRAALRILHAARSFRSVVSGLRISRNAQKDHQGDIHAYHWRDISAARQSCVNRKR
jgi:hypothetical protein